MPILASVSASSKTVVPSKPTLTFDYLLVAGGGMGGVSNYFNYGSGGGGAGGYIYNTGVTIRPGTTLSVNVGGGGGTAATLTTRNGINSYFTATGATVYGTNTAVGGGAGASVVGSSGGGNGGNGGSGGGGSSNGQSSFSGGTAVSGQGSSGGSSGGFPSGPREYGGGGGGYLGSGGSANATYAGNGGPGDSPPICGISRYTGSISGTTLTVTAILNGNITLGQVLVGTGITNITYVTAQNSSTEANSALGLRGTYTVTTNTATVTQTVGPLTISGYRYFAGGGGGTPYFGYAGGYAGIGGGGRTGTSGTSSAPGIDGTGGGSGGSATATAANGGTGVFILSYSNSYNFGGTLSLFNHNANTFSYTGGSTANALYECTHSAANTQVAYTLTY